MHFFNLCHFYIQFFNVSEYLVKGNPPSILGSLKVEAMQVCPRLVPAVAYQWDIWKQGYLEALYSRKR